jgi:hypothetical protein
MLTSEDIILEHASRPYDPRKRREYYLRTRQLKGRKPGSKLPTAPRRPTKGDALPDRDPRDPRPSTLAQRRAKRRKEIEARVIALTKRLEKLRSVLKELVEAAQVRSGVEPSEKSPTTSKRADTTGPEKRTERKTQTATQKKESAERSKEYYEEHKDPSISKKTEQLQRDIKLLEQKIMRARRFLKTVAANARNDAVTKPVAPGHKTS